MSDLSTPCRLELGSTESDHLVITPLRREVLDASDAFGANRLVSSANARVGPFTGHVTGILFAPDFHAFRDQIRTLYRSLRGTATFATLEGWLEMVIRGDGLGHLNIRCLLRDPHYGHDLRFDLASDQTLLFGVLQDLDCIAAAFPIVRL